MAESDFSGSCIAGYGSSPFRRGHTVSSRKPNPRPPGSRTRSFRTCQVLRPRRAERALANIALTMSPSVILTTSASGTIKLSRLNGWPIRSPADASPTPSRRPTHGSGPMRIANPSPQWTCTTYSLPVSTGAPKFLQFCTIASDRSGQMTHFHSSKRNDRYFSEAAVTDRGRGRRSWREATVGASQRFVASTRGLSSCDDMTPFAVTFRPSGRRPLIKSSLLSAPHPALWAHPRVKPEGSLFQGRGETSKFEEKSSCVTFGGRAGWACAARRRSYGASDQF